MQPSTIDHKASLKGAIVCFQHLSFRCLANFLNFSIEMKLPQEDQVSHFLANLLVINNPSCKYPDSRYTADMRLNFLHFLCRA